MKTTPKNISKEDALRAYAKMMHHLSVDYLEPLLADDFHYASQWVFEEITSKQQYLDYMRPKLESIRQSGARVWAELGELQTYPSGPCLVMAQGEKAGRIENQNDRGDGRGQFERGNFHRSIAVIYDLRFQSSHSMKIVYRKSKIRNEIVH